MTNGDLSQILLYGSLFLMCYVILLYLFQNFSLVKAARKWLVLQLALIFIVLTLIAAYQTQTVINIDSFFIKKYGVINLFSYNSEPFGPRYEIASAQRIPGIDWVYQKIEERRIRDRGIWVHFDSQSLTGKHLPNSLSSFFWELEDRNGDLRSVRKETDKVLWDKIFEEIEVKREKAFSVLDSILEKVGKTDSPQKIEELFASGK